MLFNDRIRHLDRRIMPGVSKLDWVADKHALEFYYKEARRCVSGGACVWGVLLWNGVRAFARCEPELEGAQDFGCNWDR